MMTPPKLLPSLLLLPAVLLFAAPLPLAAQSADDPSADDNPFSLKTNQEADPAARNFLNTAAQNGHAALAIAQLARQRATNADVRELAHVLIEDHATFQESLRRIAQAHEFVLPAGERNPRQSEASMPDVTSQQRQTIIDLQTKHDSAFDRAFVNHVIASREQMVRQFEDAIERAESDSPVTRFAREALPELRVHLQLARAVQGQLD